MSVSLFIHLLHLFLSGPLKEAEETTLWGDDEGQLLSIGWTTWINLTDNGRAFYFYLVIQRDASFCHWINELLLDVMLLNTWALSRVFLSHYHKKLLNLVVFTSWRLRLRLLHLLITRSTQSLGRWDFSCCVLTWAHSGWWKTWV